MSTVYGLCIISVKNYEVTILSIFSYLLYDDVTRVVVLIT